MKHSHINLGLLTDANIFETIHETKKQFKELFTEIANSLENTQLTNMYSENKGCKISMGNELNKCPYQVLDIFRNFDKQQGHNIRILNWWGHGLYILVFFGKDLVKETLSSQEYFRTFKYSLTGGSSPWDYSRGFLLSLEGEHSENINIEMHLSKFGYLQWYKKITLDSDTNRLQLKIANQLDQIFHFHRI